MLTREGVAPSAQDDILKALLDDPEAAAANAPDRAMLGYAMKLTRTPAAMTVADVDRLRAAGFDDRAIHDVCTIVAYFAFVNRLADGLGVELEPRFGS